MNKKRKNVYFNIVFAVILLLCIASIIASAYHQIKNLSREICFQKLWNDTNKMRDELQERVESDTRLLETIGGMLADLPDMEGKAARNLLELEKSGGLFHEIELLFPDGSGMSADGKLQKGSIALNYWTEEPLGAHITGKIQSTADENEWLMYNIVPIMREGKTVALLCGKTNLASWGEYYRNVLEYSGSRFYLISVSNGEFLVDTLHNGLGNVKVDAHSTNEKEAFEEASQNMRAGIAGQAAFYSSTVQEKLYCVYEPVGIQDWVVLLGIPESIVFGSVNEVNALSLGSTVLGTLALILFFAFQLARSKKAADELEEQVHRSQTLRHVQERLFYSIIKPEELSKALEEVADLLTAEEVYLWINLPQSEARVFHATQQTLNGIFSEKDFSTLIQILKEKEQIYFSDAKATGFTEEEKERLQQAGIHRGMGITLRDSENQYRGILFAVNMTKEWNGAEPLEWMRFDFSMVLDNMEAFQQIKKLGSKDQLTGLLNRNSYQKAMEFYECMGEETLCCVYIDVDGLHELNNKLGHAEGDQMLKTIARFLQEIFGGEATYRIGGDEFLIFCYGIEEEEMGRKLKSLHNSIEDAGYHVSLGTATRREAPLVYGMVRLAENRMYEAKRQYYRERKNGQKVREMNRQLEATLLEKRDLDAFCSVLEYRYVGVYIVNLSLDTTRSINIPDYFARKLEQTGGKYSEAIRLYSRDYIVPEFQEKFLSYLDYEELFIRLSRGETPELTYFRQDGTRLILRIYPTPDFDEFQKECIWTFEILENERQISEEAMELE